MRFEITGTATDIFTLEEIQEAIKAEGALRVSRRHAFGWRNQPHVATFAAENEDEARAICDRARARLPREGGLPALLPHPYGLRLHRTGRVRRGT